MARSLASTPIPAAPALRDVVELLKPVTWFPPIWAFVCGVVSSGVPVGDRLGFLIGGMLLAGPLVCGTSQAVNDWYDRHVDAINQPERPIPSGRIAGRWGLWIAIIGSIMALALAAALGRWVLAATTLGVVLAWAYSAPPLRLKRDGWLGPAAVAFCYEGLTWFTGATVMLGALPSLPVLTILLLYSAGAHGIMTLNDFKAIEGDRQLGINSLPVVLGVRRAALYACAAMALPQIGVIVVLWTVGLPVYAAIIAVSLVLQLSLMARLMRDPAQLTPWYNGTGVTLYVLGMLASAIGLSGLAQ